MGNATRLDRSNKSQVSFGTGVPDSSTRGNIYLDESTAILYVLSGSTWYECSSENEALWYLDSGSIVNKDNLPIDITANDDCSIAVTGGKSLTLDVTGVDKGQSLVLKTTTSGHVVVDSAQNVIIDATDGGLIFIGTSGGADGQSISIGSLESNYCTVELASSGGLIRTQDSEFILENTSDGTLDIRSNDQDIKIDNIGSSGSLIFEAIDDVVFSVNGAECFRMENFGAIFNEDSGDLDFQVNSDNTTGMFFVDGGADIVSIGTNAFTTDPASAELNISDHTWLLGQTIYDLDFTTTTYNTVAKLQSIGIAVSGNDTPFYSTILGATYNSGSEEGYLWDIGEGVWVYDSADADQGWKTDWSALTKPGGIAMMWPLNRQGNWSCTVTYYVGTVGASDLSIHIAGLCHGSRAAALMASSIMTSGQQYRAFGTRNVISGVPLDSDSYRFVDDGTSIGSGNTFTLGLRVYNNVVQIYDDQSDSWENWSGGINPETTDVDEGGSATYTIHPTLTSISDIAIVIGSESGTPTNLSIQSILFEYLQ